MTAAETITGLLLLANVALLSLVVHAGVGDAFVAYTPEPFVTLKEQVNQERLSRARWSSPGTQPPASTQPPPGPPPQRLNTGFLIAGMEGFQGEPCPALAALMAHMDGGIQAAGGQLPEVDRDLLLTSTSCAIDDPLVNLSLRKYRGSWVAAGLKPLPPFRHLGKP
jgi:hypothetical protein